MSKQDTYACAEIEELLSAYADGELNNDERAALESHVASCPSCAAKLAELDALRAAVAEAAEDDIPVTRMRAAVMQTISAEPRVVAPVSRVPLWRRWGTIAAAFVCVVLVVIALASSGLFDDMVSMESVMDDMASGGDMAPEAPMEPSYTPDYPAADRTEDSAADDKTDDSDAEDVADGINKPGMEPDMESPSDVPGEKPSGAGKVYALKPVYADSVNVDGTLDAVLVGEWEGDGLFLSFAKPEVKVERTPGDVQLGSYELDGERLTIVLEGGEILEFEVVVEEGVLWLIMQ